MPRYIYTIGLQGWSRSTTIIRRRPRPAITSKTGVGARHLQGPTHYIWCQHVILPTVVAPPTGDCHRPAPSDAWFGASRAALPPENRLHMPNVRQRLPNAMAIHPD